MRATTPTNNRSSIIQKIKGFFNDKTNPEDDDIVVNEASFHVPMSQRAPKKEFDKVNQTMPHITPVKKQFSIDDDDEDNNNESHSPKSNIQEVKLPERRQFPQQQINRMFDGYEEIDIKQLSVPRLSEKDQLNKPYQKGQIINFPPTSTFKVSKVPNVYDSLFEYIMGTVNRDIVIDCGWIYVLKNISQDKFKVCSSTNLSRLFKVFIKKNERKPPIKLAFVNLKNSAHAMPQVKDFSLTNKAQMDLFFIKLRGEIQKHGLDLQFKK